MPITPVSLAQQTGPEPSPASRPKVAPRKTFLLIQVLRGLAALMVVWHHTTYMQNERSGGWRVPWLQGAAGVDLFFVISGFVMALSSRSLRHAVHPARTFLARRLERVVPLYWLATTVKLILAALLAPRLLAGTWHIVASYLFLPARNATGALHPVLIVGWTLNFEMFFYVVLALGLILRLPAMPYLTASLSLLGALGVLRAEGHLGLVPNALAALDPLLFEFLFGVLLAAALPWLRAPALWHKALCLALTGFAFAVIVEHPAEVVRQDRVLVWGLSAAVIVAAALALEDSLGPHVPRWLLAIGDASYSNYLTHTLLLAALGAVLVRSPFLLGLGWTVQAILCVLLCTLAAQAVHRAIERPMMLFFRSRSRDRPQTALAIHPPTTNQ